MGKAKPVTGVGCAVSLQTHGAETTGRPVGSPRVLGLFTGTHQAHPSPGTIYSH